MPEVQQEKKGVGLHPGVFAKSSIENKTLPASGRRKLLANCEGQANDQAVCARRFCLWFSITQLLNFPITQLATALRIDLHHVNRLAYNVNLCRSQGVAVGIEDIEFAAVNYVDDCSVGDRLDAGDVEVGA